MTTRPMPYDAGLLAAETPCEKCGYVGTPKISFQDAHTVYSACDLHYPECLVLRCRRCGDDRWMHTADYRPPTPGEIARQEEQIAEGGRILKAIGLGFLAIFMFFFLSALLVSAFPR